jgi:hypothetical protein
MNCRVVVLAVVGALGVTLESLYAEDPASNRPERATQSQTPSRAKDNPRAQDRAARETPAQEPPTETDSEEHSWTFDQSLYTNDPKTGSRVLQYAKKKPAYRDPYSFLDSPHEAYPFGPDPYLGPYYGPMFNYGLYPYYENYARPYPYGPMPYTPSDE